MLLVQLCVVFISTDIVDTEVLRLVWKTMPGIPYAMEITDLFPNKTSAILTLKTTSVHIANLFLDHSVVRCGIPMYLLADKRPLLKNIILFNM